MTKILNVLCVDNSKTIIKYIKLILAETPAISFQSASTIIWAKTLINEETDVVILDINLPDGNGIEFLQWIKQNYPGIRVIVFTNNSNLFIQNTVRELGADFLDKSLEFEEIPRMFSYIAATSLIV